MSTPSSYRPRVKIGTLRQTTKNMMATKTTGAKVGDSTVKKFLKEEKGLRRMAYGDKSSTVETWKGRHYMKEVKEKIAGSGEVRESFYGKKHTAEQAFRDTVKEEVRQEQASTPAGPSKEEQMKQKRLDDARTHLRQYERADEIRKQEGDPLGRDKHAPTVGEEKKSATSSAKPVPLAGRSSSQSKPGLNNQRTSVAITGSGATAGTTMSLPGVFGLRGRVLRLDSIKQVLSIRVLNAPSELAIFIGRDREIKVPTDARCWRDRHSIACSDIRVGDVVDVRGKILNNVFASDEVYVNGGELPDFVVQLRPQAPAVDLPNVPPDDLAIG